MFVTGQKQGDLKVWNNFLAGVVVTNLGGVSVPLVSVLANTFRKVEQAKVQKLDL